MTSPDLTRDAENGGWFCHACKRDICGMNDAINHIVIEHYIPRERVHVDPATGDIFIREAEKG